MKTNWNGDFLMATSLPRSAFCGYNKISEFIIVESWRARYCAAKAWNEIFSAIMLQSRMTCLTPDSPIEPTNRGDFYSGELLFTHKSSL